MGHRSIIRDLLSLGNFETGGEILFRIVSVNQPFAEECSRVARLFDTLEIRTLLPAFLIHRMGFWAAAFR